MSTNTENGKDQPSIFWDNWSDMPIFGNLLPPKTHFHVKFSRVTTIWYDNDVFIVRSKAEKSA